MMNVLSQASSPYLLQHADQPVHWQEWGDFAFSEAKKRNCLIFLSIGYSTCHWCHVMAHESFDDPNIANILNESFINIKVDREEMPDVDATFMAYVQAVTGQGGWPMSIWLTPEGAPVFGGTYFPPDPSHGRASFINVCNELQRVWLKNQESVKTKGEELLGKLREQADTNTAVGEGEFRKPARFYFEKLIKTCSQYFDTEEAGFGHAPKFPRPALLRALSAAHAVPELDEELKTEAQQMFLKTLDAMAAGGIHDQLGGGFHRYSVDRYWHVPHFEKMLYDQAQLIRVYADAYLITKKEEYAQIAEFTAEYVFCELDDSKGGFYCGEDADSLSPYTNKKQEGAFFLWSAEEVFRVLDPQSAQLFCARYGIQHNGNIRPESDPHHEMLGLNVLYQAVSLEELAMQFSLRIKDCAELISNAESILLQIRAQRPPVHKDDKILLSWNAMMISSLAYGSRVLNKPRWLERAKECCDFLKENMWDSKVLYRSWRDGKRKIKAFPVDYAQLIEALIDLYATTADQEYLEWAKELQNRMNAFFWNEEQSGYMLTSYFGEYELLSLREDYDGAEPSTQSIAASNLLKLAALFPENNYNSYLDGLIRSSSKTLGENPFAVPLMLIAVDGFQRGLTKVDLSRKGEYWKCFNKYYLEQIILGADLDTALVCKQGVCLRPPENVNEFRRQLGIEQ